MPNVPRVTLQPTSLPSDPFVTWTEYCLKMRMIEQYLVGLLTAPDWSQYFKNPCTPTILEKTTLTTLTNGGISALGGVLGTGSAGYIPSWTGPSTIGNAPFYVDGYNLVIPNGDLRFMASIGSVKKYDPTYFDSGMEMHGEEDSAYNILQALDIKNSAYSRVNLNAGLYSVVCKMEWHDHINQYGGFHSLKTNSEPDCRMYGIDSGNVLRRLRLYNDGAQYILQMENIPFLDVATANIINVVDPVNAQDAATKNYVDSYFAAKHAGMASYNKTNLIPIYAGDVYHAIKAGTTGDISSNFLDGFSFDEGRVVDANITSIVEGASGKARINCSAAHTLTTGDIVNIVNAAAAGYNGNTAVTVVDSDTFDCDNIAYVADEDPSSAVVNEPAYLKKTGGGADAHYLLCISVSGYSELPNKTFKFEVVQNVTDIDTIVVENTFRGSDIECLSSSGIVELDVGDRVWMQIKNTTPDATDFTIKHLNFALSRQ